MTLPEAFVWDPDDQRAARLVDGLLNRQFLDPLLRGGYLDDVLAVIARHTDGTFLRAGDESVMNTPTTSSA